MSAGWIAWTKGLTRKPEVMAVARATGRDRRQVAGLLMEFWEWADSETEDGSLPGWRPEDLCEVVPGSDAPFWLTVAQAGWLQATDAGLVIPNFGRWMGASAKKRLHKNVRQARWRAPGQSGRDVDAAVDAGAPQKAPTREPNRTEPDKEASLPSAGTAGGKGDLSQPTIAPSKKPNRNRRDELWQAVVEVTGADPVVSATHIGRVCSSLRKAETAYTPAEVRVLPALLAARGFTLPLSLGTVEKYIGWSRCPPTAGGQAPAPPPDGRRAKLERLQAEAEQRRRAREGEP